MTKETKITADEAVENLQEFAAMLHEIGKDGIKTGLVEDNHKAYLLACFAHDISHALIDITKGKTPIKALEEVFGDDDEDDSSVVGSIAVNLKTGEVNGIENISNPKLKAQIAAAVHKLADELGGNSDE